MKKIGILTFHRALNYGAVLQSYSLVNYLRKRIPDALIEIIDYSSSMEARYYEKKPVSYLLKKFDIKSAWGEYNKKRVFKSFSDNLPISQYHLQSDDIKQLNEHINNCYDIVISGSDAIFNWSGLKFPTAFFLHDIIKPKLTYAASAHRLFYRDADSEKIKYVGESIGSLTYFGARDKETERLASFCGFNGNVHHNCDPALLLDIDDIHQKTSERIILKKCGISNAKPIIIVMTPDTRVANVIKAKYEKDYNIVSLFISNGTFNNTVYSLTPFEWATVFSKAVLTVTEYFHATILSLLNGTPVLSLDSLDDTLGYEGKIKDLLTTRLDLPFLYLNKREIIEKGASVITERIGRIQSDFNANFVRNSINKEITSADSFLEHLMKLV
mgnify:CR=1 FL=1